MAQWWYYRDKALEALGGYCRHCGIRDKRVLDIDHINGGGSKEKYDLGSNGMLKNVVTHPEKYQLLCANCHRIRHHKERSRR